MSALPLFQLATRLNTQNPYETQIHNEFTEINLYMNIGISNWHIWSIDPRKWKSLVHNSKSEMERCEKVAFQLIKIRKMNISRNIKIEYVTDVFVSVGSSRMKFILFNRGWAHKSKTVTYISIKITRKCKRST